MRVVGISEGFHDASASLVEVSPYTDEIKILECHHAERFTGKKNDPVLPKFLRFPHADISVFYEDTELKNQRRAESNMSLTKNENECSYHLKHHLSHAAAAYYTAPFDDDIVVVVIDAIGAVSYTHLTLPTKA